MVWFGWALSAAQAAHPLTSFRCPDYTVGSMKLLACECVAKRSGTSWWLGGLPSTYYFVGSETCFDTQWVLDGTKLENGITEEARTRTMRQIREMQVAFAESVDRYVGEESLVSQQDSEQIEPLPEFLLISVIEPGWSWRVDLDEESFVVLELGDAGVPASAHLAHLGEDAIPDLVIGVDDTIWTAEGPFSNGEPLAPPSAEEE